MRETEQKERTRREIRAAYPKFLWLPSFFDSSQYFNSSAFLVWYFQRGSLPSPSFSLYGGQGHQLNSKTRAPLIIQKSSNLYIYCFFLLFPFFQSLSLSLSTPLSLSSYCKISPLNSNPGFSFIFIYHGVFLTP